MQSHCLRTCSYAGLRVDFVRDSVVEREISLWVCVACRDGNPNRRPVDILPYEFHTKGPIFNHEQWTERYVSDAYKACVFLGRRILGSLHELQKALPGQVIRTIE